MMRYTYIIVTKIIEPYMTATLSLRTLRLALGETTAAYLQVLRC